MVKNLGIAVAASTIALLITRGVVAGAVQTAQTLSALTVPAAVLPSGCALTPPAPGPAPITRGGVTSIRGTSPAPFPANPWSGTDRRLVTRVHTAIDGARQKPLPDRPPTVSSDAAAAELKWAENILEAYHAAYTTVDGHQVEVFAVKFNDVKLATTPEPLSAVLDPPRGPTQRIVRGATVARVSAPTSTECFGVVRTHIQSLK